MTTKLISTRFPLATAEELQYLAEQRNINLSDLVRLCCSEYLKLEHDKVELEKLKNAVTQNVFLMLNATINLSREEREEAARTINFELKEEVVR